MLVGEAPGGEEIGSGKPFVGPAGRVLGVACHAAGVERAEAWVTNAVKCLPPKRGKSHAPTKAEIEWCKKAWLGDELREKEPRVVVAVGGVALGALTGRALSIEAWRGAVMEVE
jgi:DNA polymerase